MKYDVLCVVVFLVFVSMSQHTFAHKEKAGRTAMADSNLDFVSAVIDCLKPLLVVNEQPQRRMLDATKKASSFRGRPISGLPYRKRSFGEDSVENSEVDQSQENSDNEQTTRRPSNLDKLLANYRKRDDEGSMAYYG